MNVIKNVIPLIVFFSINSVNAKRIGGARPSSRPTPAPVVKQPVAPSLPERQPSVQQPITSSFAKAPAGTQEKSYKDLVNYVKNASNVWNSVASILNVQFINSIATKARQLNLDNTQLESLLQTARDVHGVFTGNQDQDRRILTNIGSQIRASLNL